jgi:hypothetical protein
MGRVALSPCAAGGSGGRERAVCFQPAGWAGRVLSDCRRGAHGAFDAAITRGDATRHVRRSCRQPARASLRSALVGAVRGLCAPRSWTQSGACALRARGRRQAPVRSARRGRRRNLVRPRRRSAAKPERLIDGFAGWAVWHYPPAQQGVVAAANARCAFSLQAGRAGCSQTAAVARTARSMPPSPEVMPHGTCCEVVANLLALRARGCRRRSREAAAPAKHRLFASVSAHVSASRNRP